jgi:plasmid stabilization system protein ParE
MATVRVLPRAVHDLLRLDEFLRAKNVRAANSVSQLIAGGLRRLQQFPKIGRLMDDHPNFRELCLPFRGTAYVIRYQLFQDDVVVVRVWHSREARH